MRVKMNPRYLPALLAPALVALWHSPVVGQTLVSFREGWDLTAAVGPKVVQHGGRESLYVEGGRAILKDTRLNDGTIEVDVAATTPRAFAGIIFRVQSSEQYEEAYVRLHKSGSPDAVQYAPVFNGVAAWQLHGPGDGWGTASFDRTGWVPLRLEIAGNALRVFAGTAAEPVLVTRLRRDEREGLIGVSAVFGVYFSNFRYTPRAGATADTPVPETAAGTITRWDLSSSFEVAPDRRALEQAPAAQSWKPVASEPSGLVNISRYHKSPNLLPESGKQVLMGVYARARIESARALVKKLLFGYSDDVVIFLNGKPIFAGRSAFRSRDPLFQGVIGYHDTVFLDLKQGTNELVFAVADGFGGWGLMARLENPDGVTVRHGAGR
jgi:hypothetical protein